MAAAPPPSPSLTAVASVMESSADAIWDRAWDAVSHIRSYDSVTTEALRVSHVANIARAATTLASGRLPEPEEMSEVQATTLARLRAGVPIEDVIAAYRISISATFSQFIEAARTCNLEDDQVTKGTTLLWGLSDLFMTQAIRVHRNYAVETAMGEIRLRNDHVRGMLNGHLPRASAEDWLPGVRGPFRALLARPSAGDLELDEAHRRLGQSLEASHVRGVLGVVDEMVAGYIADTIPGPVRGLSMAVGHPVEIGELPASLDVARRLLHVTHSTDRVLTIETCGWRLSADAVEPLAQHLRAKYIDPLLALGDFGLELLPTLAAFLDADRHIDRCAASLNLHSNSMRYRLRRINEALDVDLARTDTLVEVAMAMEIHSRDRTP